MSNSNDAVIIAALGLLGTLAAAIVSQLLSARARRDDFKLQRSQRQEDYARERQEVELATKRSCYIAMMTSSRSYRVELMNYLYMVKQQTVRSAARDDLENERRACLASLGEVQIVATLKVLSTIDPVNWGLSKAYDAINHLEARRPEPGESFEEVHQSLTELRDQWSHMSNAMRHDLGIKD
jgi:hypothetical protein